MAISAQAARPGVRRCSRSPAVGCHAERVFVAGEEGGETHRAQHVDDSGAGRVLDHLPT